MKKMKREMNFQRQRAAEAMYCSPDHVTLEVVMSLCLMIDPMLCDHTLAIQEYSTRFSVARSK